MPERKCEGCKRKDEWGCEAKPHTVTDEDGNPKYDKAGRPVLKWTKPARIPEMFDGEETYACPRQTLKENARSWSRLLMYYAAYKDGFLPQAGAVIDQSNAAMEALNVMNATNQECDDEINEKSRLKSNPSPYGRML